MKIDLNPKVNKLCVGDLKLGDVFQVKSTCTDYYMIVQLFTPHVTETKPRDEGCTVLSLNTNQVMKLNSNLPAVVLHDVVITNKGK